MTAELLKCRNEQLVKLINDLIEEEEIWKQEIMPESWSEAEILPIYINEEETPNCNNARGITLLKIGYIVVATIYQNLNNTYNGELNWRIIHWIKMWKISVGPNYRNHINSSRN